MQIKSNLDLLERIRIALKLLKHIEDIIDSTEPHNTKHADSLDVQTYPNKYLGPLSKKQTADISDKIFDASEALRMPYLQSRYKYTENYLHFPHQNKQLKKIFGNHHVTKINKIEKKGNKLVLTLGHRRPAMTAYLDVLNDDKYRKDHNVESWFGFVPKQAGNLIPKNCSDPSKRLKIYLDKHYW